MNRGVVVFVLFLVLFLISCTQEVTDSLDGNQSNNILVNNQENESSDEDNQVIDNSENPNNNLNKDGECTPHWDCIGSKYKAYQIEDCSWTQKKECTLGCFNGNCKAAKTCDSGFKCKNNNTKGFQDSGCFWSKEVKCDWGCTNAKCNPIPENATNVTLVEEKEEDVGDEEEDCFTQ